MTTDDTATPSKTLNFGFADILGVTPMPAPQPRTTGHRQTVRLANALKEAAATIAAKPPDQRHAAGVAKIRELLGAPYGRPLFKIPNQPGNPNDLGTIFNAVLREIFGLLADAQHREDEWNAVKALIDEVRKDPSAAGDIRLKVFDALVELMTAAGFGISTDCGNSSAV
jgi:hypothetical protein